MFLYFDNFKVVIKVHCTLSENGHFNKLDHIKSLRLCLSFMRLLNEFQKTQATHGERISELAQEK